MVKTVAAFVLCMALFAVALWFVMTAAGAQAQTLPMAEVRSRIEAAVREQFTVRVVVHLQGCKRIDEHGGQCVVRLYTRPYREKYCGVGYARVIHGRLRSRGLLRPCPEPHGAPYGGLAA